MHFRLMQSIVLNGERREVADDTTVAGLLGEFGLSPLQVAVERNREIVPRARYAETRVQAGDTLEIVTFVGGG
jgi:thiamine biosynthesis protein ThiS